MRDLIVNATNTTPEVRCLSRGHISVSGISMPEDAAAFFFEVFDWISDYYRNPKAITTVEIDLTYFNSSSSSMLRKLFFALNRLQMMGKSRVQCKWYLEPGDEEIEHIVEDIRGTAPVIHIELIWTEKE